MSEEKKQTILARIRPVIASVLKISEAKITPTSRLKENLGADSLDAIEIIMELENEFDIVILDEDAQKMKTIADVVAYLVDNA